MLASNPNKGVFKDPAMRSALSTFFDKKEIVNEVYKGQASVSTQMYPVAELPKSMGQDVNKTDPSKLTKLAGEGVRTRASTSPTREDEGGTLPRLAEILAAEAAGRRVRREGARASRSPRCSTLPNHARQAPDLLLWTFNPDAAHPDTWVRIFMNKEGAINYLQCSDAGADAAMDAGLKATTTADVQAQYGKAGDLLAKTGAT